MRAAGAGCGATGVLGGWGRSAVPGLGVGVSYSDRFEMVVDVPRVQLVLAMQWGRAPARAGSVRTGPLFMCR